MAKEKEALPFIPRIWNTPETFPIKLPLQANDSYLDANYVKREIAESRGLTVNANVFFNYRLNKKSGLKLSVGTPLAIITGRPDGLTRPFVTALDYKISF